MSLITLTSNNSSPNNFTVRMPNNIKLAPYSQVKLIGGTMEFTSNIMIDESNDTWAFYEQDNDTGEVGWTAPQFIKLRHGSFRVHPLSQANALTTPTQYDEGSLLGNWIEAFRTHNNIPYLSLGPNPQNFVSINPNAVGNGNMRFSLGKAVIDTTPSQVLKSGDEWYYVNDNIKVPPANFVNPIMAVAPAVSSSGWVNVVYNGNSALLGGRLMYPACNNKNTNTLRHSTCRPLFTQRFNQNYINNSPEFSIGIFMENHLGDWCGDDLKTDNMFYSIGVENGSVYIKHTQIDTTKEIGEAGYYTPIKINTGFSFTNNANTKMIGAYTFYDLGTGGSTTGTRGYRIQFIISDNFPDVPTQLSTTAPATIVGSNISGIGGLGVIGGNNDFSQSFLIPKEFYKEGIEQHLRVGHINRDANAGAVGSRIAVRTTESDGANNLEGPSFAQNDMMGFFACLNAPFGESPNKDQPNASFIDNNMELFFGCNIGNTLGYTQTGFTNGFTGAGNNSNNYSYALEPFDRLNGNNSNMYLEIPELGIKSILGNYLNGKYQSVLSPIIFEIQKNTSDLGEYGFTSPADIYCNLNNATEKNINSMTCRLITAQGQLFEGMVGNTNITIYVRQDPIKAMAIEYKKAMINMSGQIKESMNTAINQKLSENRI